MNRDLLTGILVSVLLHITFLYGFNGKAPPPKKVASAKDDLIQFEMPPIEEEKEDKVQELNDQTVESQMAPPSLVDMPTVVPINAFTQPLAPPPPPGLKASKGAISIPVTKPGSELGKGMKDLFDVANLDQRPVPQFQPRPTYPYEMSRAGISGEVVVEFIINASGDVTQTQVIRSSHREFEAPAIQAVLKWKFKAGRKGGRAVNTRVSQLIEFNLEDNR